MIVSEENKRPALSLEVKNSKRFYDKTVLRRVMSSGKKKKKTGVSI